MDLARITRLLCQTWSYDKFIRLGAYGSKALIPIAQRLGPGELGEPLALRLAALSSAFAKYRIVTRLSGIPLTLYALGEAPSDDPVLRHCNTLLNWSNLVYYPLEHLAWLCDIGVLQRDSSALWLHSCRVWFFNIVVDLVATVHSLRLVGRAIQQLALEVQRARATSKDTDVAEQQRRLRDLSAKRQALLLKAVNVLADLGLAFHWGFPSKSPFSETAIAWLGVLGTLAGGYMRWKET